MARLAEVLGLDAEEDWLPGESDALFDGLRQLALISLLRPDGTRPEVVPDTTSAQ
jgi:hypothetical protein